MRVRALLIWLIIVGAMVPLFFLNRWMQRTMRPRESAGRLFLFLFANFLLIVVYTGMIIGMIVRLFPR
jgi:hypothetical protein